jgi:hypothetical protein
MQTKTITRGAVSITVSEATIEQEIRRGFMADEGISMEEPDPIVRVMRTFTWPTFTACVIAATGVELPITFETFRGMPGNILSEWADAVYELNPLWRPNQPPKAPETPTETTTSVEG